MRRQVVRVVLSTLLLGAVPFTGNAAVNVGVSIGSAPPPLPYYEQPLLPDDGYVWMPGYWAWSPSYNDYFWVPGTWILPPQSGYLWTPGYWRASDGFYNWSPGYWGQHVGFYGGVNYGFGYTGMGYQGGYWRDRRFHYNRAVNNVNNVHVTRVNVYNQTVVNNITVNRVSYNGGNGGLTARPNAADESALRERHVAATQLQTQHEQSAIRDRALRASVNQGKPAIAATAKANDFSGKNAIAAREAGGPVKADRARSSTPEGQGEPSRPQSDVRENTPAVTDARARGERTPESGVVEERSVAQTSAQERVVSEERMKQRQRIDAQERQRAQESRVVEERSAPQSPVQERAVSDERVKQQRAQQRIDAQERQRAPEPRTQRAPDAPVQERRAQEPPREVREERREAGPGAVEPPQNRRPNARPDDNSPR